jgi:hypothetical protein
LGKNVTLIGGEAIPLQRVSIVLGYAPTVVVHSPEGVLRLCQTLLSQRTQQPQRSRVITTLEGVIRIFEGTTNRGFSYSHQHPCCQHYTK